MTWFLREMHYIKCKIIELSQKVRESRGGGRGCGREGKVLKKELCRVLYTGQFPTRYAIIVYCEDALIKKKLRKRTELLE